jgi:hypothetical protein
LPDTSGLNVPSAFLLLPVLPGFPSTNCGMQWNPSEYWEFLLGRNLEEVVMRFLIAGLILGVSPALAQQTSSFPVSVPPECTELAQRENVPTLIENKYQAALARIKLARLSGAEPIVAQCKQAVERLKAATKG